MRHILRSQPDVRQRAKTLCCAGMSLKGLSLHTASGKEEGGESKCNMTIVVNGSGATNLAYVGTQPWDYPPTIDISGPGKHTLTQYGNLWTNASGPFPLGLKPNSDPAWQPAGITPANLIPDQTIEGGVSAEVVRNGYDALRRLGRLDLARHYPELGVTDVCAGN